MAAIWLVCGRSTSIGCAARARERRAGKRPVHRDQPPPGPERTMRVIVLDRRSLPADQQCHRRRALYGGLVRISDELLRVGATATAERWSEVTAAGVRNNFGNAGIDLHPDRRRSRGSGCRSPGRGRQRRRPRPTPGRRGPRGGSSRCSPRLLGAPGDPEVRRARETAQGRRRDGRIVGEQGTG